MTGLASVLYVPHFVCIFHCDTKLTLSIHDHNIVCTRILIFQAARLLLFDTGEVASIINPTLQAW